MTVARLQPRGSFDARRLHSSVLTVITVTPNAHHRFLIP